MGWLDRLRKGASTPVTEAVTAPTKPAGASPKGWVDGIPPGGTSKWNAGDTGSTDRQSWMSQLYGTYAACPWVSGCVDLIARTITAGGLQVVPDDESDEDLEPIPQLPPEVQALQDLLDYVNPREDIRQLMRGVITDLLIFGDAFIEVIWLLGQPVALYSLDCPSMIPKADEHGVVSGFWQMLDTHEATFEPHEVIHISLDSPRGGVYGKGPTEKALVSATTWLFAAGLLKETMRKGDPPHLHVDHPIEVGEGEYKRWQQRYETSNLGIQNIGNPVQTRGKATVAEISQNRIAEYKATKDQSRDEILAEFGVPPRKLSIAEAGQLGGTGEGTTQDKTFRINTCGPIAELVLEKFNYHLVEVGFGIEDWHLRFGEVDWRDDKVIDDISSTRLRDGRWTLNRSRKEIGEPAVEGGDEPVIVDRQNLVQWVDMAEMSKAQIVKARGGPSTDDAEEPDDGSEPEPTPAPAPKPKAGKAKTPRDPAEEAEALEESFRRDFQRRRREALRSLPQPADR